MHNQKRHQSYPSKTVDTERVLGRSLPAHTKAEQSVLTALLINDNYVNRISEFLIASDFYIPAHKLIYQAILDLVQQNKRIDLVTLQDELTKRDQLESVGGIVYLVS